MPYGDVSLKFNYFYKNLPNSYNPYDPLPECIKLPVDPSDYFSSPPVSSQKGLITKQWQTYLIKKPVLSEGAIDEDIVPIPHEMSQESNLGTEQEAIVSCLRRLKIPLKRVSLHQLFDMINRYQDELINSKKRSTLFAGMTVLKKEEKEKKTLFELEIHSAQRMYLLFRKDSDSIKESGSLKTCYKIYPIAKNTIPYVRLISNISCRFDFQISKNETQFLCKLKECTYSPVAYHICTYPFPSLDIEKDSSAQLSQHLTMKYYPQILAYYVNKINAPNSSTTDEEKKAVSLKIISAVEELHHHKIIHQDIKPENIFLTETLEVVLADYGFTCLEESYYPTSRGTVTYFPPEIFSQRKSRNGKAVDIWALGCVLWYIWGRWRHFPWEQCFDKKVSFNEIKWFEKILSLYYQQPLEPDNTIAGILGRIFRQNPDERLTISQVKNLFQNLDLTPLEKHSQQLSLNFSQYVFHLKKAINQTLDEEKKRKAETSRNSSYE